MPGSASIAWVNYSSNGPAIFTTDVKAQTGTSTHVMTGLPAACLLVISVAGENNLLNTTMGDNRGLTWTKRADASAAGSGDAEIWTAPFAAGGNITVTAALSAQKQSSALYVITNPETVFGTTGVTAVSQAQPLVSVTTTRAASIIVCVTSDFTGQSGAATYRDTVTQLLDDFQSGAYHGWHYYKQATTATLYNEGMTVPAGQSAGSCGLEIRSN